MHALVDLMHITLSVRPSRPCHPCSPNIVTAVGIGISIGIGTCICIGLCVCIGIVTLAAFIIIIIISRTIETFWGIPWHHLLSSLQSWFPLTFPLTTLE